MRTGLEIGGALGRGQRQREQQDAQAGAFSTGGWQGATNVAAQQGNFTDALKYQQQATTQQNTGIARLRETLPVLARVGETLAPIPEAERGAAAQRFLPMLERLGIPQDQLAEADWSDNGIAQLRALAGLSRFEDIKTLDDGSIVGIGRDGSSTQLQAPSLTAGAPTGHRYTDPSRTQLQRIPGWEPPAQVTWGAPTMGDSIGIPNMPVQQSSRGEVRVVPGAPQAVRVGQQMGRAQAARVQALYQQSIQTENVLAAIAQAEGNTSQWSTGLAGQVLGNFGGTQAADLQASIDTIVANIGFDRLRAMRDSSPTGGALGQVTERELALLQAVITSLRASQSEQQFRQNLERVRLQYEASMARIRDAYAEDFGGDVADAPASATVNAPPASGGGGLGEMSVEQLLQLREQLQNGR